MESYATLILPNRNFYFGNANEFVVKRTSLTRLNNSGKMYLIACPRIPSNWTPSIVGIKWKSNPAAIRRLRIRWIERNIRNEAVSFLRQQAETDHVRWKASRSRVELVFRSSGRRRRFFFFLSRERDRWRGYNWKGKFFKMSLQLPKPKPKPIYTKVREAHHYHRRSLNLWPRVSGLQIVPVCNVGGHYTELS